MKHKFAIGTQYKTRGKFPQLCTVEDLWTVTNAAGDVVKILYVTSHVVMGQKVMDYQTVETTIAMGLVNAS